VNDADAVSADLLRRARGGDADALGRLLNDHRDFLRRLANQQLDSRLNARLDASDLVQQTCLSVHKRIEEFEGGDLPQFLAWLRQVHEHNIQNAIRDQLHAAKRQAGREEQLGNRDPEHLQTTPSQLAARDEEARRLQAAIEQLPADEQQALRLRYLDGRTLADVSREMGLTRDAVVWLIKRGMKQIRQDLKEGEPGA
jgi:RNA polymerase sigma-70 factor (ECF subfamily)